MHSSSGLLHVLALITLAQELLIRSESQVHEQDLSVSTLHSKWHMALHLTLRVDENGEQTAQEMIFNPQS